MEIILALIAGLAIGILAGAGACWAAMRSRGTVPTETREQIRDTVAASSAQALRENSASFLNLANERLNTTMEAAKGEFNQRHEQFQALVKPLTEDYRNLNPQRRQ